MTEKTEPVKMSLITRNTLRNWENYQNFYGMLISFEIFERKLTQKLWHEHRLLLLDFYELIYHFVQ